MSLLIDGVWQQTDWRESNAKDGSFVRKDSSFRDWIRADGSTPYAPEADRYHLYVAHACPWAHRTLIFRQLKKLDDLISISIVHPLMAEQGWTFEEDEGCIPDIINHKNYLHEVYSLADNTYTGRATVPILWDKKLNTIVSNESSEIIRMFNTEFAGLTGEDSDYYPEALREDIDEINDRIYHTVNNGVYRTGFAKTQAAYEIAFNELFQTLDLVEERLGQQSYLVGEQITEADWRLYPTLIRFDPVYVGHFKCNLRRIIDYPNISRYLKKLHATPGVADLFNIKQTKKHYYMSHTSINPTQIVPIGPEIDYLS